MTVEQLTLDFEYVINEVIRNDASWSKQFCSFSDYDIVILEVGTCWAPVQAGQDLFQGGLGSVSCGEFSSLLLA